MNSFERNNDNADLEATQRASSSKDLVQKLHAYIRPLEIGIAVTALVNVCLCGVAVALFNKQSLLITPNILANPFLVVGQMILSGVVVLGCIVALTSRVRGSPLFRFAGILVVVAINMYLTVHDIQFLNKTNDSQDPVYCGAFVAAAEFTFQSGFSALNLCHFETAIQVMGLLWSLGLLIESVVNFWHERQHGLPRTELEHQVNQDMNLGVFGERALPTSRLEQYFGKNYEAVMSGKVTVQVPVTSEPALQQPQQKQQQDQAPPKLTLNDYIRHNAPSSGASATLVRD